MSLIDTLLHRRLVLTDPKYWSDNNDKQGIEIYRQRMGLTSVRALCLTAAAETFHHWQVFAGGNAGVCVYLNRSRLLKAFEANHNLLHDAVQYKTLAQLRAIKNADLNKMPFFKRHGFRDELEYRVIALGVFSDAETVSVPIDLSLISHVTFSPFVVRDLALSVGQACKQLPGCSKIKFNQSNLIDNKAWLQAVEAYSAKDQTTRALWEPLKQEDIDALIAVEPPILQLPRRPPIRFVADSGDVEVQPRGGRGR